MSDSKKLPRQCQTIEEIRKEIDLLDMHIISLLGIRFQFVKEVVKFKSNTEEVVAQGRFDEVIASRRKLADENGISPDIVEKIYRLLLGYFIEEEHKILEKMKNTTNNKA